MEFNAFSIESPSNLNEISMKFRRRSLAASFAALEACHRAERPETVLLREETSRSLARERRAAQSFELKCELRTYNKHINDVHIINDINIYLILYII